MPKTSVKEINQTTSYRRRELRYSTKVKCDDFGLWLIQIGIFVLYVKLVVRTTYAQAQTLRGYTFMWSSRWGEGWSGKKLSKFRWKWMVTGVGEGIHKNWMSTRVQTVFQTSVWSPKFWRPGAGGLAQFEPIQTDGKRGKGGGCKNWTFFMIIINVWSLTKLRGSHPEVFLGKGFLKMCNKFTGEHPCRSVISKELPSNFIEITLRHGCSPVILLHAFRTPFPRTASEWMFL